MFKKIRRGHFSIGDRVTHHRFPEKIGNIKKVFKKKTEGEEGEEDVLAEVKWRCGRKTIESVHHLAYIPTTKEIKRRAEEVRSRWDDVRWKAASGLPDNWDQVELNSISTHVLRKAMAHNAYQF